MRYNLLNIAFLLFSCLASVGGFRCPKCSLPVCYGESSTALCLSYTGTYKSRRWSEEENDFLLALREEHLNPETGKVRRGSWDIICSKLSRMANEKIEVKVAQHQVDNVMKRRRGAMVRRRKSKGDLLLHKWSDKENQILMEVRKQYLDANGRVLMGAWPNITREASTKLGFEVGIYQAGKRAKDIVRREERQRIERGSSNLQFTTTLDSSLVEAMLSIEDESELSDNTLYQTTLATPSRRVTKEVFRAWTHEDTQQLVDQVEKEERKLARDGISGNSRRPRGFWVNIADRLNRCPTQCRNRYSWLKKVDTPMFH